jgi:hypothetical protein
MKFLDIFSYKNTALNAIKHIDELKALVNKVIDDKGFYALNTNLQNELLKTRQGKCKSCKCSK